MKTALIVSFCFHFASGVIHSHQYIYTATSGIPNFPEFVVVGSVDGQQISYFDSKIKNLIPRQEWVKGAVDADFWNRNTQLALGTHQTFMNNINVAKERFNQTGGVHVNQRYYGCEWDDVTGVTKGFKVDGYDGEDFLSLDLENMRYIAPVPQALPTKHKLDKDRAQIENDRHYYTKDCIDWLKKYVEYGRSTLGRTDPPDVVLFQRDSSPSGAVCHATGFYPEGVMITWKRDGVEMQDDVDVGETLPNADGNFQKKVVLTVPLEERKKSKYICEVTHSSGKPIVMILNEEEIKRSTPGSVPVGPIIGVGVGLLVLIAVIAGFVVLRNKKAGFVRAKTDESSVIK